MLGWSRILVLIASCLLALSQVQAKPGKCPIKKPIIFGGLDWDSAAFHNGVARYILEKGYGCKTDSIPGSTIPIIAGMIRGSIDISMEIWRDNITEAWGKGIKQGRVFEIGVNFPDASQGWFVPRYMVEGDKKRNIKPIAPELKNVSQLKKYKALFKDPEAPSKGRFYNCIPGWACEMINSKKLKVYHLEKSFINFHPGSGGALSAAIVGAYKKGKPIVFYYWGPTWLLGKYDLLQLEEPAYDKAIFENLKKLDNPKHATAYPVMSVYKGISKGFKDKAGHLLGFIEKYRTDSKMINNALVYLQDHKMDQTVHHFLQENPQVWHKWLEADIIKKVEKALTSNHR